MQHIAPPAVNNNNPLDAQQEPYTIQTTAIANKDSRVLADLLAENTITFDQNFYDFLVTQTYLYSESPRFFDFFDSTILFLNNNTISTPTCELGEAIIRDNYKKAKSWTINSKIFFQIVLYLAKFKHPASAELIKKAFDSLPQVFRSGPLSLGDIILESIKNNDLELLTELTKLLISRNTQINFECFSAACSSSHPRLLAALINVRFFIKLPKDLASYTNFLQKIFPMTIKSTHSKQMLEIIINKFPEYIVPALQPKIGTLQEAASSQAADKFFLKTLLRTKKEDAFVFLLEFLYNQPNSSLDLNLSSDMIRSLFELALKLDLPNATITILKKNTTRNDLVLLLKDKIEKNKTPKFRDELKKIFMTESSPPATLSFLIPENEASHLWKNNFLTSLYPLVIDISQFQSVVKITNDFLAGCTFDDIGFALKSILEIEVIFLEYQTFFSSILTYLQIGISLKKSLELFDYFSNEINRFLSELEALKNENFSLQNPELFYLAYSYLPFNCSFLISRRLSKISPTFSLDIVNFSKLNSETIDKRSWKGCIRHFSNLLYIESCQQAAIFLPENSFTTFHLAAKSVTTSSSPHDENNQPEILSAFSKCYLDVISPESSESFAQILYACLSSNIQPHHNFLLSDVNAKTEIFDLIGKLTNSIKRIGSVDSSSNSFLREILKEQKMQLDRFVTNNFGDDINIQHIFCFLSTLWDLFQKFSSYDSLFLLPNTFPEKFAIQSSHSEIKADFDYFKTIDVSQCDAFNSTFNLHGFSEKINGLFSNDVTLDNLSWKKALIFGDQKNLTFLPKPLDAAYFIKKWNYCFDIEKLALFRYLFTKWENQETAFINQLKAIDHSLKALPPLKISLSSSTVIQKKIGEKLKASQLLHDLLSSSPEDNLINPITSITGLAPFLEGVCFLGRLTHQTAPLPSFLPDPNHSNFSQSFKRPYDHSLSSPSSPSKRFQSQMTKPSDE